MAWHLFDAKPLSKPMIDEPIQGGWVNSLAPGKFKWNFRYVIFNRILAIAGWGISCEIALIWMSLDFTNDQSTLVQVMAWCRQATSHYLNPCWPRSLPPYGVTRPQWVNTLRPGQSGQHFADNSFKHLFLNEDCCNVIHISLKSVPEGPIDINPSLLLVMAWCRAGDKPISGAKMAHFSKAFMIHFH